MDLATIAVYLEQLDAMRRDPDTAAWAASVQRELLHPLNQVEEYLQPIAKGQDLNKYEQLLRFKVRRALAIRSQQPTKD